MEELKELVEEYYNFKTNVLITESELYDYYIDTANGYELVKELEKGTIGEYINIMILKDILYDLVFDREKIKLDLESAEDFFYEEYSKQETIKIYKKIKKLFPTFVIKEIEKEV